MNALQRGIILARNEEKQKHYDNTVEIFKGIYDKIKAINEQFIINLQDIVDSYNNFSRKVIRKTVLRYLLILNDIRYDILDEYAYKFNTSSMTRYQSDRKRDVDVIRQDMRSLPEMEMGFGLQAEDRNLSRVQNFNFNSISQEIQENVTWFMDSLIQGLNFVDPVIDLITQSGYIYKYFASQLNLLISNIISTIYKISYRNKIFNEKLVEWRRAAATKLQAARRGQQARRNL